MNGTLYTPVQPGKICHEPNFAIRFTDEEPRANPLRYLILDLLENVVSYELLDELPRYCLLYTSPSPRDRQKSRMPSSA